MRSVVNTILIDSYRLVKHVVVSVLDNAKELVDEAKKEYKSLRPTQQPQVVANKKARKK